MMMMSMKRKITGHPLGVTYNPRSSRALTVVAAIAWCGVLLQLYLSLRLAADSGKSLVDGLVGFFGYFTVLTNIFVALATTLPLTFSNSRAGRWFRSAMTLGCATTAIVFVGVVYHLLLRNLWAPAGLQWIADVILHYAVPKALLVNWIMFPPTQELPRWAPLAWCIYPLIYIAYALARGALLSSYPYHFIDVTGLGYSRVLLNSLGLLVVFGVLGGAVYAIARLQTRAASGALPPR
jgi:hypothetical protein